MLVLSRKLNQELVIFEKATGRVLVRLQVTEFRGDKAKIGLTAEGDIGIDRVEVYDAKLLKKSLSPEG